MRGKWQKYSQAPRERQSYILLTFGCLVSTSTILNETRGKIGTARLNTMPPKMITGEIG